MKNTRTRILVEGALLVALAYILSFLELFHLPQGGGVTIQMLPIVIMSLRHGAKWGCFTGFVNGLLQMIMGFSNVMYCPTLITQIGCILLDYLLAFSVLGIAGAVAEPFGEKRVLGAVVGTVVAGVGQFLCSFVSGFWVWASFYEISGMELVVYSLTYNASYMIPNILLTSILVVALYKAVPKAFARQK